MSVFLNHLLEREIGLQRPEFAGVIARYETLRRIGSIQLSKTKEIQSDHAGPVLTLDIDRSEMNLLSGAADASVSVFDIDPVPFDQTQKYIAKPLFTAREDTHKDLISCVQWYKDTGMFFTGSFDKTVAVWDTNFAEVALRVKLSGKVYCMSYCYASEQSAVAAIGTSESPLRLWDIRTAVCSHSLLGHRDGILSVCWSPASEYLLASGSLDRTVRLWDIRRAAPLVCFDQFNNTQEEYLKGRKWLREMETASPTSHDGAITALTYTTDGRYILSSGTDSRMRLWNSQSGLNILTREGELPWDKERVENRLHSVPTIVSTLCGYHPCGNVIRVYELLTGRFVTALSGHYDRINACIFHPAKEELYSGGYDHQILAWNPATEDIPAKAGEPENEPWDVE